VKAASDPRRIRTTGIRCLIQYFFGPQEFPPPSRPRSVQPRLCSEATLKLCMTDKLTDWQTPDATVSIWCDRRHLKIRTHSNDAFAPPLASEACLSEVYVTAQISSEHLQFADNLIMKQRESWTEAIPTQTHNTYCLQHIARWVRHNSLKGRGKGKVQTLASLHPRITEIQHSLSKDYTVSPSHARIYLPTVWTTPSPSQPQLVLVLPTPEGWKAEST